MNRVRRVCSALAVTGLLAVALAPAAEACCIMPSVKTTAERPKPGVVDQAAERFLFIQHGDRVTAHVQVQYVGDARDFSLVIPVPAEPVVGVGSNALFTQLRAATKPTFTLREVTEGTCRSRASSNSGGVQAAPAKSSAGAPRDAASGASVVVVSQTEVGPYSSTVLKAENADALKTWLTANEYAVPAKLDETLKSYIASGSYFVALKLQSDREAGDLQPVTLNYASAKPGLPMRLASLSAVPDMDVFVWVLGDARAVPDNYDHVEINEARIDWFSGGANYRQVVTEAMDEADGKAFTTDYAGPAAAITPGAELTRAADLDPGVLAGATGAGAFVRAVKAGNFFPVVSQQLAFLKRHVPKPESLAGMQDADFFDMLATDEASVKNATAGTVVDAAKAVAELETSLVGPAKAIRDAFATKPYLTQLYTTMSPEEMVLDPTFVFSPSMDKVSKGHTATAITECSDKYYLADAPVRIKLSTGESFYASEGVTSETKALPGNGGGKPVVLPASRRIGRCGNGAMMVRRNNANAIAATLNDLATKGISLRINTSFPGSPLDGAGATIAITFPFASNLASAANAVGGFGCAGCSAANAPPVVAGSSEFGTYAFVFAGLLGYRKWAGKRPR